MLAVDDATVLAIDSKASSANSKAEEYKTSQRSAIANEMEGEVPELEERLRAKDQMLVEKWFVKSYKSVGEYEVLLLRAINGTDIMVMKLEL